jgi:hypothetical protein
VKSTLEAVQAGRRVLHQAGQDSLLVEDSLLVDSHMVDSHTVSSQVADVQLFPSRVLYPSQMVDSRMQVVDSRMVDSHMVNSQEADIHTEEDNHCRLEDSHDVGPHADNHRARRRHHRSHVEEIETDSLLFASDKENWIDF